MVIKNLSTCAACPSISSFTIFAFDESRRSLWTVLVRRVTCFTKFQVKRKILLVRFRSTRYYRPKSLSCTRFSLFVLLLHPLRFFPELHLLFLSYSVCIRICFVSRFRISPYTSIPFVAICAGICVLLECVAFHRLVWDWSWLTRPWSSQLVVQCNC